MARWQPVNPKALKYRRPLLELDDLDRLGELLLAYLAEVKRRRADRRAQQPLVTYTSGLICPD